MYYLETELYRQYMIYKISFYDRLKISILLFLMIYTVDSYISVKKAKKYCNVSFVFHFKIMIMETID
jgi:hypothetical protein